MPQIQRYLFRQLMAPTVWAILAFSGVGILSESLTGLDLIVNQRQSAWVFVKVTLLAIPKMLSLIIPLSAYVAAMMTFNRLHTEQEIVVCYAGGVSPWRVASPAMRLATLLALVTLAINLWLVPISSSHMRATINAARTDLAATLVRAGQFTEPAPGLTVYAQTIDRGGLMHNLFIHQEMDGAKPSTYTAAEGRLVKGDGMPAIVMQTGAVQSLSDSGELNYLAFDNYVFDLSNLGLDTGTPTTKAADRYMSELLHPSPKDEWGLKNRKVMLAEFHSRLSGPLYAFTFIAFAISAILGGGFSRLGYTRRVAWVSALAIATRVLGFMVEEASGHTPALNILQYAIPLAGIAFALGPYIRAGRMRRSRGAAPALAGTA